MRLFIDSAIPTEWETPAGAPGIAGATTNPVLIARAGRKVVLGDYQYLVAEAAARRLGILMLQLPRPDPYEAEAWAEALLESAQGTPALVFKIPADPGWARVHAALRKADASTLVTAIANPVQLLWARDLGADYVAPYLARMEADGRDPWALVEASVALQDAGGPRLLAASLRTPEMLSGLIARGAHAATVSADFLAALVHDPLTLEALARFAQILDEEHKN